MMVIFRTPVLSPVGVAERKRDRQKESQNRKVPYVNSCESVFRVLCFV